MTADEVALVQSSFAQVAPIADTASALFYGRLFETNPELRPLFAEDMTEQRRKLIQMLAMVVGGLSRPETVLPAAGALGVRHVAYGVTPEHYAPVGAALLWTLEQGLGEHFTPEVRSAWTSAYGLLSGTMIQEAYPHPATIAVPADPAAGEGLH
ncbi:globin family protein [Aurantimonas sp. 22II-16-19i]|uniref:globin family protein n=1 Tax=Aurantimonas sp. 22II-16-19i TaxID=1317114 RepID=UPI0009F7C808|nr:globin family protein [Aurantimonas sp. 22II-16-19i]ORE97786.1 hypothetical protein ATO4_07600 [Aurantimonas sp. 22II-16-19i]